MRTFAITMTLLSLFAFPRPANAQSKTQKALSPQALVSKLYDAHKSKNDPLGNPADPKILNQYFTERLTSLYIQDQVEANGEVGRFDADPLYYSQDSAISDFRVRAPLMTQDGATVAVNFANAGLAHQVKFFLTETMQGWRIYDIRYEDGTSLHSILEKKL